MKLQHLPMGARFEYQGKVMVKAGPLTATTESGGQCLIPRYAVLKPLDPMPAASDGSAARQLAEPLVLEAFERFFMRCTRLVDDAGRLELSRARQRFLDDLK
jgi:hypothetical protein